MEPVETMQHCLQIGVVPLPAYVVGWRYFVLCVLGWLFSSVVGAFAGCVFLRLFSTLFDSLRLFASSIDSFRLN